MFAKFLALYLALVSYTRGNEFGVLILSTHTNTGFERNL